MNWTKTILEAIRGTKTDYTKGSINEDIILLSIPMVIEMLGEGLFAIVDAYFVSQVSNEAFATVILTETIATIIYSIAIGVSIAATAMVARRIGEGKPEAAAIAAAQTIGLTLVLGLFISFFGYFFSANILRMMGADEMVIKEGLRYTQILLGFNFVIMLLFVLNGIFRGAGDASMAMRSLWIANIINIFLDPLLIFGLGPIPAFGVTGAAIATTIGRSTAILFQLYVLFNGKRIIQLSKAYFQPKYDILKKIINVAFTGAGQHIIASASWIFLMMIIADYGTATVNGYGIAIRIIIFTILPSWGIANAAATLMGQNLGAKQPDRAEKSVWLAAKYNALFLLIVAIIYFIWARPLVCLFNDDPAVVSVGVESLRIFSLGYVSFGLSMVINQAFSGAGDTRTPTLINFIAFWLIQIPLAYTLATVAGWGAAGVYWSVVISESIMAIFCIILFKKGRWRLIEL